MADLAAYLGQDGTRNEGLEVKRWMRAAEISTRLPVKRITRASKEGIYRGPKPRARERGERTRKRRRDRDWGRGAL
jgi:hypothetical protein